MEAEERLDDGSIHNSSDALPLNPVLSATTSTSSTLATPASTEPPPSESQESLFLTISNYPFTTDSEYQAGLSSILGHPGTPATPSELSEKKDLVLRTQCFYIARKFKTPKVDPRAYKAWLASTESSISGSHTNSPANDEPTSAALATADPSSSSSTPSLNNSPPSSITTTTPQPPPTYPTSFASIVDLITNNKPIPGIEEIPTTVLEPGSSKRDHAVRRRKPWEKKDDSGISSISTAASAAPTTTTTAAATATDVDNGNTAGDISKEQAEVGGISTDVDTGTDIRGRPLSLQPDMSDANDIMDGVETTIDTPAKSESPLGDVFPTTTDFIPLPTPASTSYNKGRRKDVQGVVKLLQPDAVPDSGLVAKD